MNRHTTDDTRQPERPPTLPTTDSGSAHRRRPAPIGAGRRFSWLMVVTGGLGLLASAVIMTDSIRLAEDPAFRPVCDVGSVLSCTDVMSSDQASLFGLPNPLFGLVAYAVVVAGGIALLAGARFPRWCWIGLNLGGLAGAAFCMWLMGQALYSIGALCLWCCLAWAATIALFWYSIVHSLEHRIVPAPRAWVRGVLEFHWAVPVTWYAVIVLLIAIRFGPSWQSAI